MRTTKNTIPNVIQTIEYLITHPNVGVACGVTGAIVCIGGLTLSTSLTVASAVNMTKGG